MNKQLPTLEEATELFKQVYQMVLDDPVRNRMSHINMNSLSQREMLMVLAIDANCGHGQMCMEAIKEADKIFAEVAKKESEEKL